LQFGRRWRQKIEHDHDAAKYRGIESGAKQAGVLHHWRRKRERESEREREREREAKARN
jgi:hypothetical protein